MTPKSKNWAVYLILGGALYLVVAYIIAHGCYAYATGAECNNWLEATNLAFDYLKAHPGPVPINNIHFWKGLGFETIGIAVIAAFIIVNNQIHERSCPGIEKGSAKWNTDLKKYNKEFTSPLGSKSNNACEPITPPANVKRQISAYSEENIILSDDVKLSMQDKAIRKNGNVLVIGGAGTGKSYGIIKPNVLQAHSSFCITDPSGEILRDTGAFLESIGYKVKVLNLVNFENSASYNPFNYVRDDLGVQILVNCLMKNTSNKDQKGGDQFWDDSTKALLKALVYYLINWRPKSEQNFASVMKLLRAAQVDENNPDAKSPLDKIFDEVEAKNPNDIGLKEYKTFKMGAGKTLKSILISTAVRLSFFNLPEFIELTNSIPKDGNPNNLDDENWVDELDMSTIGEEKTALFLIISQADDTFNFLANMMYSQLFETLYYRAENVNGGRLPVQVRFLLDEFANIGQIPDFDKKLSTMRKYGMSCTIILQSLAQIKSLYEKDWGTIVSNCDSFVFLGGQEQETLEYVSKLLGKTTIRTRSSGVSRGSKGGSNLNYNSDTRDLLSPDEVRTKVNKNYSVVIVNGLNPFYTKKYNYKKHPNYKYTADASNDNTFDITAHKNQRVINASKEKVSAPSTSLVAAARLAFNEALKNAEVGIEIGSFSEGFKRCPPRIVPIDTAFAQIKLSEAEDIPLVSDLFGNEELVVPKQNPTADTV